MLPVKEKKRILGAKNVPRYKWSRRARFRKLALLFGLTISALALDSPICIMHSFVFVD
jgi:hypothetical protein